MDITAFQYLDMFIMAFWAVGIGAFFMRRTANKRSGLDRARTRQLAEKLGLAFDEHAPRNSVSVFGQLPDGRAVRLYEEHKKKPRGLLPWQRGVKVSSVLEVGVESEAFDRLTAIQQEDARTVMHRHFRLAQKQHADELMRLGFSAVTLSDTLVRVRGSLMSAGPERIADLMVCLGCIATDTETRCVSHARSGKSPQPAPDPTTQLGASHQSPPLDPTRDSLPGPLDAPQQPALRPSAPDVPAPDQTWNCSACNARNPNELAICQMCSTPHQPAAQPAPS